MKPQPDAQRRFALEVARKLHEAGYVAYWAGGCVRDELLGRTPKDYDVASSARPEQVRALFGEKRTLAIGAAFGVIAVLGPREAGVVEVATFRRDAEYHDGRRPTGVTFTDAEEDARRRDFTMNALFYDPVTEQVIDFVGGRDDLARGLVRAVGVPQQRFEEDKLRMLRAVRMVAVYDFALEPATCDAVQACAAELKVVSPERISQELRAMLGRSGQATAARLLAELKLLDVALPELLPTTKLAGPTGFATWWDATLATLAVLEPAVSKPAQPPAFVVAWAALWLNSGRTTSDGDHASAAAKLVQIASRRLRMANEEREGAAWLVQHQQHLDEAATRPWSQVQPLLAHPHGADLVTLAGAQADVFGTAAGRTYDDLNFCRERLAWPRERLNPPPLVTGDDLIRRGLKPDKSFAALLQTLRHAQLDGEIATPDEGFALIERLRAVT